MKNILQFYMLTECEQFQKSIEFNQPSLPESFSKNFNRHTLFKTFQKI